MPARWASIGGGLPAKESQDAWLTNTFGESVTGDILMGLGVLMILLRAKTSESLESKGAR